MKEKRKQTCLSSDRMKTNNKQQASKFLLLCNEIAIPIPLHTFVAWFERLVVVGSCRSVDIQNGRHMCNGNMTEYCASQHTPSMYSAASLVSYIVI
jgi:hypothetical protein